MSDTPRMEAALLDAPDAGFSNIWKVGCELERELNAANAIIRQQQLLDEDNMRLTERIKRLEEELINAKGMWAALVADVVLYEDRGERIKRLEEENDALRADLLLWNEKELKL